MEVFPPSLGTSPPAVVNPPPPVCGLLERLQAAAVELLQAEGLPSFVAYLVTLDAVDEVARQLLVDVGFIYGCRKRSEHSERRVLKLFQGAFVKPRLAVLLPLSLRDTDAVQVLVQDDLQFIELCLEGNVSLFGA